MGLRSKLKARMRRAIEGFSGEHAADAPKEQVPYERPGVENKDAKVVMARLN